MGPRKSPARPSRRAWTTTSGRSREPTSSPCSPTGSAPSFPGRGSNDASKRWEGLGVDETARIETSYRRADGSTFPVEVHVRRIDVHGEDRFLASSRDITERRAYQRRIERENERLDEFAEVVSHDLRNPLNVLSGFTQLARDTGDLSHLERCDRPLKHMEQLIDDVLTLARQGRTVGESKRVGLADVAREARGNIDDQALSLDVETSATIRADPGRLKQLFENLFRNAVEHGSTSSRADPDPTADHDGPPVTITVGEREDGFYVADGGPGIPPDERGRVFESGYTTSGSGTGFGLAIVEGVAEAHGWDVAVDAGEEGGARFTFTGVESGVDDR